MGCLTRMPEGFPETYPENAGNMIHGRAPFEMFENTAFYQDKTFELSGRSNFTQFANEDCSHFIVTIANLLVIGDMDGAKYSNFQRYLESIKTPLVIFGLGAQAKSQDLTNATIAPEAIELMKYLGQRCEVVGVRGPFTQKVFSELAGVENTFVTGCPSFFQRPDQFKKLRENVQSGLSGRPAYSGTVLHNDVETRMLVNAIKNKHFLVEPVNKFNHELHLAASRGQKVNEYPWFLRPYMKDGTGPLDSNEVDDYFRTYYRLFRDADSWYKFNSDLVSFTYGTRFHVNMASILSGKPALWVTHDSRTEELTRFLHLPNVPLNWASEASMEELILKMDYTDLFDNLHSLYGNFNEYLDIFGLPALKLDF